MQGKELKGIPNEKLFESCNVTKCFELWDESASDK
jgi:hypothetical protein